MRVALRAFRHQPASYVFAIAVLAVGCGMGTAVFSLVHAVLLRPLPFRDQNALRVIWKTNPRAGVPLVELAYPELGDLRQNVKAFESVAVLPTTLYGYGRVLQTGSAEPVQIESAPVSHEFFGTLGVAPAFGRDFAASDERVGAAPVVILSDSVWRERFNADAGVIGKQIRLSGTGFTIIGVMGRDVEFPHGAGLWVPLGVTDRRERRGATYLQAIARVRPGFSDAQVNAALNTLFTRLSAEYPQFYSAGQRAVSTPLPEYLTGSARPQLLMAFAASLLLLAAACITAANLFLSRTLRRSREIATRIALGASSRQLAGQFVWEGALAALFATMGGVAIASLLIRLLVRLAPSDIPGITLAGIHAPVMLFAAGAAAVTAVACSAAPMLRGRLRASQNAFTLVETAATVVLLTVSLLAVVKVRAMLRADTGFSNRDAVTANLPLRGVDAKSRAGFYETLLERLRANPGVTSAAAVLLRPLEGTIGWEMHYQPEYAATTAEMDQPATEFEVVTPGYFETVGTPLLEGRDFTADDRENTEKAVIVSRSLAARFRRAGHSPIGLRIRLGGNDSPWLKVVGVVADARYRSVMTAVDTVYTDFRQTGIPVNYVAIRGRASEQELTALMRRELARMDPSQALANVASVGQLIDANTARARFNMTLLTTFGMAALLLAAAGIYSVVTEAVAARRRDIAIRSALGAPRPTLVRWIVQSPVLCVLAGEAVGSAAVYAVHPASPVLLAGVLVFLLVVSLVAAALPAWKATGQAPYPVLQCGG